MMGEFIQVEKGFECLAANDKAQGGLGFFLLGFWEGDFLFVSCSQCFLTMFTSSSQDVPQVPNNTSF